MVHRYLLGFIEDTELEWFLILFIYGLIPSSELHLKRAALFEDLVKKINAHCYLEHVRQMRFLMGEIYWELSCLRKKAPKKNAEDVNIP